MDGEEEQEQKSEVLRHGTEGQ
uniref:Uncharacterized protein n=1 Tax=Anguilla anguilla TaxID=7936 RepID=A0A0E9TXU1_ANGAN